MYQAKPFVPKETNVSTAKLFTPEYSTQSEGQGTKLQMGLPAGGGGG